MKRALIALASVGIVAAAVGVKAANAQIWLAGSSILYPSSSLQPCSNLCSISTLYPSRLPSICPSNLRHRDRLHPWLRSAAL
jgi:hypothetical protein